MFHPVVYISGLPNDDLTRASGCELISRGVAAIVVHPWVEYADSMGYGAGDIICLAEALIERCDAVLFVPGWESCPWCQKDLDMAEAFDREVYFSIDDLLKAWGLE